MISVVVTCYNLERYIAKALETVFAQENPGEFEVIVVDDCSTDGSAEAIRRFEEIRYLRTPQNNGVMLAMLAGIAATSGDIICFLDGDDLWEPGKLRAVREAFERDPRVGFVTHDLAFIDRLGRPVPRRSRPREVLGGLHATEAGELARRGILFARDYVWLGSAFAVRASVVRLKKFAQWAQQLPDPRNTYQDWPLAYWAASFKDVRFVYIPLVLFRYRVHGHNHSGDGRRPELMTRNLLRERNTLSAMKVIAEERGGPGIQTALERRLLIADYLFALYRGNTWRAIRLFGQIVSGGWNDGSFLARESVRLIGATILGPRAFTGLKTRLGQ